MTWGRGSTRKGRELRAKVLKANPVCTCIGCSACTPDGCGRPSTDDDHVVPLSQGGTDHPSNHTGKCNPCHKVKSQGEALHGRARTKRTQPVHPGAA